MPFWLLPCRSPSLSVNDDGLALVTFTIIGPTTTPTMAYVFGGIGAPAETEVRLPGCDLYIRVGVLKYKGRVFCRLPFLPFWRSYASPWLVQLPCRMRT